MWTSYQLTNKAQILTFLETDRLYAAYAIGDLAPDLFTLCDWAGAERNHRLQALALHFRGLALPALFLMGSVAGVRDILKKQLRPARVYLTCREEHVAMTREFYRWDTPIPMWRMALTAAHFHPQQQSAIRLTSEHSPQLTTLYALGGGNAFSPEQIPTGVFYGAFVEGQLIAAAGTHLVSGTYGVAAVGNIFTHPDYRQKGYATTVTSAVVAALLRCGIRDIVLNVDQSNATAIHIYERLGFERACPYVESPASAIHPLSG